MTDNISPNTRDSNPGDLHPIVHAKWYSGNCCKCTKRFKTADTVYRTFTMPGPGSFNGPLRFLLPLCRECRKPDPAYDDVKPCERCGRPVAYEKITFTKRRFLRRLRRHMLSEAGAPVPPGERVHVFCSERCASKTYHALDHAKRRRTVADGRGKTCDVCGTTFQGRADAKTCSATCRKKRSRFDRPTPLNVTKP